MWCFLSGTIEVALYVMLVAAALHLLRLARWGWNAGALGPGLEVDPTKEKITVQLPLRNEAASAAGLLRCAGALEGDIELQVLDDSDDDTVDVIDAVASELREQGKRIEIIRRTDRRGYKAGALARGLANARELVLVLDADFRPPSQLTSQLVAALHDDDDLAFVQTRWSFRNERSLLTRLQAGILDALFSVEQAQLTQTGAPLQFNGTAGLWRRCAIERAGGWDISDDALTEDLDLSFRAHEAGLRGATLPELAVSTELPDDVRAFVAQQARWVRGGALTLRTLGLRLLRRAKIGDAITIASHLARHARQPLLVAALLRLPFVAFGFAHAIAPAWLGPTIVTLAIGSSGAYLAAGARRVGKDPAARFVECLPLAALSLGLAVPLTRAFVGGLFGLRGGGFQRTPKVGDAASKPKDGRRRIDPVAYALTLVCAGSLGAFVGRNDLQGALAALLGAVGCAWIAF